MVMIPPSARSGRDILFGGPQSRFALLQPRISGLEGSCKCLRVDLGGPRDEDLVSLLVVTSAPILAVCAPGLVVMVMVRRNVLCSASAAWRRVHCLHSCISFHFYTCCQDGCIDLRQSWFAKLLRLKA